MTGQPRVELTEEPRPVLVRGKTGRPSGRAESDLLCWRSVSWLLRALRGPSPGIQASRRMFLWGLCEACSLPELLSPARGLSWRQGEVRAHRKSLMGLGVLNPTRRQERRSQFDRGRVSCRNPDAR